MICVISVTSVTLRVLSNLHHSRLNMSASKRKAALPSSLQDLFDEIKGERKQKRRSHRRRIRDTTQHDTTMTRRVFLIRILPL